MRRWVIMFLAIVLCLCLAVPAMAAEGESVWSKYNMKLYGRVKMDYIYQTGRTAINSVTTNLVDPAANADWSNDSTDFKAQDTRFGFFATHEAGDWVGKGRFEIDMFGSDVSNTSHPRFRIGYVDMANKEWGTSFRFGKDWIPISQLHPSTIDFGILLQAGNLWERLPQATVRHKINNVELLASAMMRRRTSTASETRAPWVVGRVAYNFEAFNGAHMIAGFGGFQSDAVSNAGSKDDVDRWVAGGELKMNLGPVLLKGEAWSGQAVDRTFSRFGPQLATVIDPSTGKTKEVKSWGGWLDLTYKIIPKWSFTAGVGIDDPDDDDYKFGAQVIDLVDTEFTQNTQFYVNTWYNWTKAVKAGFEWMYVNRERIAPTGGATVDGTAIPAGQEYDKSYNSFIASVFYSF